MDMRKRKFDSRHNSNQHGSNASDMHRNFSMSGSGTRGNELGRARIGAEDDDIRAEQGAQDNDPTTEQTYTTINDSALQSTDGTSNFQNADTNQTRDQYDDSGEAAFDQGYDTGTGAGGTDYVGQDTGNIVDNSIADTVAGGTASGRTAVGASADNATGGDSGKGELGITGTNPDRDDSEPTTPPAGPVSTTLSGESATVSDEDLAASGTGSGSAMNDRGARLHDIPAGTGSAQRGNRAGIGSDNEGKITGGGTASSTGMGDA